MQIHKLQLNTSKKRRKIVGRGGKKGSYSGRGIKGQKARSGVSINPLFEGGRSTLTDHMKKKKGFLSHRPKSVVISLSKLEAKFQDGEIVSRESLKKAGLLGKIKPSVPVKVLGSALVTKKLTIEKEILLSQSARTSIEKAGGTLQLPPLDSNDAKIYSNLSSARASK